MCGDLRVSPKAMSVFGVASISRLSGFRDNKTGDARRRGSRGWALGRAPTPGAEFLHFKCTIQQHSSTSLSLGAHPWEKFCIRIWHVLMCSHPTSDFRNSRNYWVSSYTSNLNKIGQSHPEIRGGGGGCTCARAGMSHPTHDLWKART